MVRVRGTALTVASIAIAACGGSAPPPPAKPADPPQQPLFDLPDDDAASESDDEPGVEFVSSHGHMEVADVEAGIAPHKEELSSCYMSRVGRRRWLGGKVSLHWDINKAGEVTAVKLVESDLGAWPVEKCLLEIARSATFHKPRGNGSADFVVPLEFAAKGRAQIWDEDRGLRAVGGQLAKLDECAKVKGVHRPRDVTITLYVGPQGKAQSVGFSSPKSEIEDDWAECAVKTAMSWRLPDPRGMIAKLAVRYRP
jgi:hypothetical protein